MADILQPDGSIRRWEDFPEGALPRSARRSYTKLAGSIYRPDVDASEGASTCSFFVTRGNLYNNAIIWEFRGTRSDLQLKWSPGTLLLAPTQTYTLTNFILVKRSHSPIPEDATLHRLTVGKCKTPSALSTSLQVLSYADEHTGKAEFFTWRDVKEVFFSDTGHLRRLLANEVPQIHANIHKWTREIRWALDLDYLWKLIWLPYRSHKENTFL